MTLANIVEHFDPRHFIFQRMSEFQLKEALGSADFSGRVSDVFASLGRDKVKTDACEDNPVKNIKERNRNIHQSKSNANILILIFYFNDNVLMFCLPFLIKGRF